MDQEQPKLATLIVDISDSSKLSNARAHEFLNEYMLIMRRVTRARMTTVSENGSVTRANTKTQT